MGEPEKDQKPGTQGQGLLNTMGGLAGQIAGITLVLVFGAVFGGLWLDKVFHTGHTLLIVLILGAGPLSLYLTFKLAMRTVGRLNPKGATKPGASEEAPHLGNDD